MKKRLAFFMALLLTACCVLSAVAEDSFEWPGRDNDYAFPLGYTFGQLLEADINEKMAAGRQMGGLNLTEMNFYVDDDGKMESAFLQFQTPSTESAAQKEFDSLDERLQKVYPYCVYSEGPGGFEMSMKMLMMLAAMGETGGSYYFIDSTRFYDKESSRAIDHLLYVWNDELVHSVRYEISEPKK